MNTAKSVVVVHEKNNPSTDFFVLPHLKAQQLTVKVVDHSVEPDTLDLSEKLIVFVRYVPPAWERHLSQRRERLAIVIFLDDDLFDRASFVGLSWRYKKKLLKLSYKKQNWLKKMKSQLWVSTPHLAEKYLAWQPTLVLPKSNIASRVTVKLFYHGSSSHSGEIDWLYPVIKSVMEHNSSICFEIIGDHEVNKLFRGLARTTVIHPMSWANYQSFIAQPGRHIGLAPLLDKSFNSARSYTKFFDVSQAGAVGIYANHKSFTNVVEHDVNGLLVDMNHDDWVTAILSLASNDAKWQNMKEKALETCRQLSDY